MSSSSILTDLTNAAIKKRTTLIFGVVASTPALQITDGTNTQYACDVQISLNSPDGKINQIQLDLLGVQGGTFYHTGDDIKFGSILRDVPISNNNGSLLYCAVGSAVILQRTTIGQWEITGFSQQLPGTRTRYAVNLSNNTLGPVTDLNFVVRPLTLLELSEYGDTFGITPFGAIGTFFGGVLQSISI